MRGWIALFIIFNSLAWPAAQPPAPLLDNIPGRTTVSLNGPWHVIVDPYETGLHARFYENATVEAPGGGPIEYNFEASETLKVPGDWNTQKEKLFFYEGPGRWENMREGSLLSTLKSPACSQTGITFWWWK